MRPHSPATGAAASELAWLNPFALGGFGPFAEAVLLCLFIYWGWDALITVNEETRDSDRIPGKAAVISTLVLLGTYLFTAFAAISFAGTGTDGFGLGNPDNAADVLATLAPPVLGTALTKVVELAICVSAISALLTCLLSSPRVTLSMGSRRRAPQGVHPNPPCPPHSRLRHGVLRHGNRRPAQCAHARLGQLPRRCHPVDRPADRLLLRRHRPRLRLALQVPAAQFPRSASQGFAAGAGRTDDA